MVDELLTLAEGATVWCTRVPHDGVVSQPPAEHAGVPTTVAASGDESQPRGEAEELMPETEQPIMALGPAFVASLRRLRSHLGQARTANHVGPLRRCAGDGVL